MFRVGENPFSLTGATTFQNFSTPLRFLALQRGANVRDVGNCYKTNPARTGRPRENLAGISRVFRRCQQRYHDRAPNETPVVHASCQTKPGLPRSTQSRYNSPA
jgi:hypothetical protein